MSIPFPAPIPDSLGPLLGADDVRDAVKATIDEWSEYYLSVISQRLAAADRIGGQSQNPNPLPNFGTWVNDPTQRNFGTGQPAAFLVTVAATVGAPDVQGDGMVRAVWRANVSIQAFGTDWQEAADLTSWYEKCVRWCIQQHRSLGGFSTGSKWIGTSYSSKDHTSTRTLGIAAIGFDIGVANVINVRRGPATVPTQPGPPAQDPTVDDVIVELTKVPVTEPLS